jgi:hypothetical protein
MLLTAADITFSWRACSSRYGPVLGYRLVLDGLYDNSTTQLYFGNGTSATFSDTSLATRVVRIAGVSCARLPCPENTPRVLAAHMASCWLEAPSARPVPTNTLAVLLETALLLQRGQSSAEFHMKVVLFYSISLCQECSSDYHAFEFEDRVEPRASAILDGVTVHALRRDTSLNALALASVAE